MRELKFRCWNGEQMVSPDYITRDGSAHWKENSVPTSSNEIMQFTGLQDRNGTNIYEGDVVSLDVIEDEIKGWETATIATVKWDDEDAGFYFETEYDKFPHVKPWFAKNVKIIGNIFENPELLDKGQP